MTRVATLTSHETIVSRMLESQKRVHDGQMQVSTGKKSQDYTGISFDALRLVNFENQATQAKRHIEDNTTADIRLGMQSNTVATIEKRIRDFRSSLIEFAKEDRANPNANEVTAIQDQAFEAMLDLQQLLNTRMEGRFLFAGGKVEDRPVQLNFSSLAQMQQMYPGTSVGTRYPVTRAQQMGDNMDGGVYGNITVDGAAGTITASDLTDTEYGSISFSNAGGSMTVPAGNIGALDIIPLGGQFTVSGGGGPNDGVTFTVLSKDEATGEVKLSPPPTDETGTIPVLSPHVFSHVRTGTSITLRGGANDGQTVTVTGNTGAQLTVSGTLADEGPVNDVTLHQDQSNTYYRGDQLILQHRADDDRALDHGINAAEAGFEKAIRAMGVMAQGGLAQNMDRIDYALDLLSDSLEHNESQMPDEESDDLSNVQRLIGRNQILLADANERHKEYIGFLEVRAANMENVDPMEAVTRLNTDSTSLEIAMKSLAKISQLTLADYI